MALQAIFANWAWGYGGDSGHVTIMEFNFPPSKVIVHSTLSMTTGLCSVGISQYRTRPNPNGPDQPIDFNWDPNFGFPPIIFDQHFTYAKAELGVAPHQSGVATVTISFFD